MFMDIFKFSEFIDIIGAVVCLIEERAGTEVAPIAPSYLAGWNLLAATIDGLTVAPVATVKRD